MSTMKIYRVHIVSLSNGSLGYRYATNKRHVARIKQEDETGDGDVTCEVEEIEVTLTKDGILGALRRYGSHPDNG
jgi:hypothetical protein